MVGGVLVVVRLGFLALGLLSWFLVLGFALVPGACPGLDSCSWSWLLVLVFGSSFFLGSCSWSWLPALVLVLGPVLVPGSWLCPGSWFLSWPCVLFLVLVLVFARVSCPPLCLLFLAALAGCLARGPCAPVRLVSLFLEPPLPPLES